MGRAKKQTAAKNRQAVPPRDAVGRDQSNEEFEWFLHRTNIQLDQAALRGRPQALALHIFDREATYEEVFAIENKLI